jgi:microcystin-dependent protein
MATVTGLTAERMLEIEGESVVNGEIISGNLILTKHDGTTIDAGPVLGPAGPAGPPGPAGGLIPGEVRLWPGSSLPAPADYGKWVWADGTVYVVATYPEAAANIATAWRTFAGASEPGGANFRVPDLRGLVPAGMDAMPGGARANRMTRSVAITLAAKTGEETHVITVPELAPHGHVVSIPIQALIAGGDVALRHDVNYSGNNADYNTSSVGGGQGHENVQPTVFVPYIVKLDD